MMIFGIALRFLIVGLALLLERIGSWIRGAGLANLLASRPGRAVEAPETADEDAVAFVREREMARERTDPNGARKGTGRRPGPPKRRS